MSFDHVEKTGIGIDKIRQGNMSVKVFNGSERDTLGEIDLSLKIGPTVFDVGFQKHMPTGKLAKWQILLSELDIVYVTQKAFKGKAYVNHLAENLGDGEYDPLTTYFLDEEVSHIREISEKPTAGGDCFLKEPQISKECASKLSWYQKIGQHYLVSAKLRFPYSNNMAKYEAYILGLRLSIDMNIQELLIIRDSYLLIHQIEFKHVPRIQNEFTDTLATLSSMIQHPDKNYIDPIPIEIHKQSAYCAYVEEEFDGKSWFHDITEYLEN
ncbi:uncharacterized protein LOC142167176 [Nicotiana tabacum]|uniref:Uncharacterized protein LOC142167176 n=1 Tax=Nicotiana tabacum TaxID=4097 RepID=A0AC58SEN6_TOBAC